MHVLQCRELQNQNDLEQRMSAYIPLDLQFGDQFFKGQILMGVCFQADFTYPA
jgi:hypothetical protein